MNANEDERRKNVQRMRTNFALEGLHPDECDEVLQDAYIRGMLALSDLLAYAYAHAEGVTLADHFVRRVTSQRS